MTDLSIYQLIKQKSKEKGKKLKVVTDYDEVIQAHKPFVLYRIENTTKPYKEYHEYFWENSEFKMVHDDSKRRLEGYSYIFDKLESNMNFADFLKKEFGITDEFFEKIKKKRDIFELKKIVKKMDRRFYKDSPFLTIAEQLLKCLKENLIEELIITSSFTKGRYPDQGDPRKIEKFQKTFGKFPNVKLRLRRLTPGKKGESPRPFFNEWVRENAPDFDLFVDDNKMTIKKTRDQYKAQRGKKRFYGIPDYKTNKEIKEDSDMFLVKQEVSDIKDQDFAIAALEMQTKQLEQELASYKKEKTNSFLFWLIPLLGITFFGLVLVLAVKKKRKKV